MPYHVISMERIIGMRSIFDEFLRRSDHLKECSRFRLGVLQKHADSAGSGKNDIRIHVNKLLQQQRVCDIYNFSIIKYIGRVYYANIDHTAW